MHIQHVCEQAHALLQARKAGAQAGWGFAKAHSSWPKPDMKASSTLGPLRMVTSACNVSLLLFVLGNTWQVTPECCCMLSATVIAALLCAQLRC